MQSTDSHFSTDFPSFLIAGQVTLEDTGKPLADAPVQIGNGMIYSDDAGAFSLRVTNKPAYSVQPMLDRQIGALYSQQVSGPSTIMAGTEDAPEQVRLVVRVNQTKTPSVLKGGIVIGSAAQTPRGVTGIR